MDLTARATWLALAGAVPVVDAVLLSVSWMVVWNLAFVAASFAFLIGAGACSIRAAQFQGHFGGRQAPGGSRSSGQRDAGRHRL